MGCTLLLYRASGQQGLESKMSMTKTTTEKTVTFEFDGFSEGYGAFVKGAFAGKFIVPIQHAHMVREGDEMNCLKGMLDEHRFGVQIRNARTIR